MILDDDLEMLSREQLLRRCRLLTVCLSFAAVEKAGEDPRALAHQVASWVTLAVAYLLGKHPRPCKPSPGPILAEGKPN